MKLPIKTTKKEEIMDITSQIEEFVSKNATKESKAVLVYCPHTTAGIMINENYDPDVQKDILKYLSDIPETDWLHSEGNSPAHIKSALIGIEKTIPIINGKLALGRWQGIAFCEFDGPREREVVISFI